MKNYGEDVTDRTDDCEPIPESLRAKLSVYDLLCERAGLTRKLTSETSRADRAIRISNEIVVKMDEMAARADKAEAELVDLKQVHMNILSVFRNRKKYKYDSDWSRAMNDAISRIKGE
jgi:hypothetical protein